MAPDGSQRESLTAKAAAMVPALLERQKEADALRRIPDSTHRDFLEAGLYRIFQPRRYGGMECENRAIIDIAGELGRGCGSSAWIFTNLVAQSLVLSMNCREAQDDVWGANPEALIASGPLGQRRNRHARRGRHRARRVVELLQRPSISPTGSTSRFSCLGRTDRPNPASR